MSNQARYWESAIAEAASGRQPPDQSAEILARLNASPVRGWASRPWPVRMAVHAGQTAIAAGVLVAIGLATGVVQWPGPDSPPINPPLKRELIATPGTKWVDHEGYVDLGQGALLLSTGAPEVRRGDSSFSQLDGLALLSTGEPDKQQMAEWQTWMQTKGVEADMIKTATRWITGTALCVLMLQGTATLDGQKVEAEKPAEPVWHKVDSLMALEKLPPEARYIETNGLEGTYLPIIATVERIEGLRFLGSKSIKPAHLEPLTRMPNLRVLDVRGCYWTEGPDYSVIARMPKLERAGLDLYIPSRKKDEDRAEAELREDELATKQVEAFRELAKKGLKVDFSLSYYASRYVGRLAEVFPDCEDLRVHFVSDDTCREIVKFTKLRRAVFSSISAREPGYAWLSKLERLESLTLGINGFESTFAYHLGKIKTLRSLTLTTLNSINFEQGALTMLGSIEQLRELRIYDSGRWNQIRDLDGQVETPFKPLKNLEYFAVVSTEGYRSHRPERIQHPFDMGYFVGTKTLELRLASHGPAGSVRAPDAEPTGGDTAMAGRLECVRIMLGYWQDSLIDDAATWAASLKRYPNLKRVEIGRFGGDGSSTFQSPRWAGPRLVEALRQAMPGIDITEVGEE